MMGGTLGNAIIKNKLFNFFSLEYWKVGYPQSFTTTVPTALERAGRFFANLQHRRRPARPSMTRSRRNSIPPPAPSRARRFPGNKIPSSRFDPLSASLAEGLLGSQQRTATISPHVNNFKKGYTETYNYYNFSDRVDYNINDNWRAYGRIGRYHTTDISPNVTPNNSQLYVPTGTLRAGTQVSGDAVWTVNPRTVVNFHGDWHKLIDAYVSDSLGSEGWGRSGPAIPGIRTIRQRRPACLSTSRK